MKQLKKLSLTLALLITAAAGAWADDTDPAVTIDNTKVTASFTMPANDVTVNYTLVRDMNDTEKPVAFSGLPESGNIIVKKGSDGKYQPAEALTIQLNDALISGDDKDIIAADGLTVTVEKKGDGDNWTSGTLADFLADMQPGTYKFKAVPKDENSPYDGTVYSSEFTVVEQYDLTVKPADEYSKTGLDAVTVGTESVTIDANTGEAPKTGIAPNTEVKIKAKHGYIIEKVEVKKAATTPLDNTTTAWTAGTFAVPTGGLTYSDAITVSGDVTLTLTDGETLTLNKGISLASGATLTIQGNGTMNVNGTNNSTASTVAGSTGTLILTSGTLTATGGKGQDMTDGYETGASGGAAINGSVTVNGGSLTATGGNGGNCIGATIGPETNGGAGGAAISGDVTIADGAVAATGGNGGSIGASNFGLEVHGGAGGAAIGGNATLTGGTLTTTQGANGTGSLDDSSVGAGGKAVAGTVTNNGGTVN